MISKVAPACMPAVYSVFGHIEMDGAAWNEANKSAKDFCRELDKALTGDWLVGNNVTVADFVVGLYMAPLFQTMLDGGFRKAAPKATAWFERVIKLNSVVKTHGHIKACAKALKPLLKPEEKKVVAPKAAAAPKPKKEDGEEEVKKSKNPLDNLPETKFDLYNFKTFFVNVPDKAGQGVDELIK